MSDSTAWQLFGATQAEQSAFGDFGTVFSLSGQVINHTPMSSLIRVEHENLGYYLKIYRTGGKGPRRYLGRSRLRAEFENARYLAGCGVSTLTVLGFGEYRNERFDRYGALLTREAVGCRDMARIGRENPELFQNPDLTRWLTERLAEEVRKMHAAGFVHGDLKWRNILVRFCRGRELYIIDSPMGIRTTGSRFRRGVIKDLACLDKLGKVHLSRCQRLRFVLRYLGRPALKSADKAWITRILEFFRGRE
ncbi:MAG: heptose kinase [Pseudomonadales bacterium]|nr:heptose kinase [Pseudomonadales bacterium]